MNPIDLKDRVVAVTGGSQGMGRAMAVGLAAAGARVVIASPDKPNLEKVAAEIGEDRALAVVCDITRLEDCQRLLDTALDRWGDFAVLINNARRLTPPDRPPAFWQADLDFWENAVKINVYGTYLMTRAVMPHLLDRGWGRVVNVTTSLRTMLRRRNSPYGVTKVAQEAQVAIWAQELEGTGVTINSLNPGGAVDSRPRSHPPASGKALLPVDVMVPAAIWLASDLSDGCNGGRYVGSLWDATLPPEAAAKKASEPSIFRELTPGEA